MNIYDSDEELYFSWYLDELLSNKVLTRWIYHPKEFILCDKVIHLYLKQLKTKQVITDSVIMNAHSYQADFLLYWNADWKGKIYINLDEEVKVQKDIFIAQGMKQYSVIDVKGTFIGRNNTTAITFPLNQKWTYQKYNIYVQKIVPEFLFRETFTPARYHKTNQTGRKRKVKFEMRSISNYLESIK